MGRRLISSDESVKSENQHTSPCSDCPFSRKSLPGWLGGSTIQEWMEVAHGEGTIDCHVINNQQCAGAAIFRANICKSPRNRECLSLPRNKDIVFSWDNEFKKHHEK